MAVIGHPGKRAKKHCGCKVGTKQTKRGLCYVVTCPDSKMMRFVSEADYERLRNDPELCVYLPEPFKSK